MIFLGTWLQGICPATNLKLAAMSIDLFLVALMATICHKDLPRNNTPDLIHLLYDLPLTMRQKVMKKFIVKHSCNLNKMRRPNE